MRCRPWFVTAAVVCAVGVTAFAILLSQRRGGWVEQREDMVRRQVVTRGVHHPPVLDAMRTVPRHLFVDEAYRDQAYCDAALPIGYGQSTPQPYVVALMAELLEVEAGDKVLEVGTGSGYQAAVLAAMGVEVYTVEIQPQLCQQARATLGELGFGLVHVRCGDGCEGWPEEAPFDGILVTAGGESVPALLLEQLGDGGHMVIPIGGSTYKDLRVVTRTESGVEEHSVMPVTFGDLELRQRR